MDPGEGQDQRRPGENGHEGEVEAPRAERGRVDLLITDRAESTRVVLASAAKERGLPEIFVPRSIIRVPAVPVLGTGKIDYVSAGRMAAEMAKAS
jgi:acyl-[acyl-carrier-protein]-phospholipid O-acyltransferase / long-chain-fatty-acid--[acyl-carrier-protein] ligase